MSTATLEASESVKSAPKAAAVSTPVVAFPRRTIDSILIGFGVIATVVFAVAGSLLTWGHNFSSDYVRRELGSQNVSFPAAADLTSGGRSDLLQYAGAKVDTGAEAQAYASFIAGHLDKIGGGQTYADMGATETAANAAVTAAVKAKAPQSEIDALQAKATGISATRNTLFKGETLRGLLLSAYAWSTVGTIAGWAAFGAFVAAGMMLVLVVLGMIHHRRTVKAPKTA